MQQVILLPPALSVGGTVGLAQHWAEVAARQQGGSSGQYVRTGNPSAFSSLPTANKRGTVCFSHHLPSSHTQVSLQSPPPPHFLFVILCGLTHRAH